MFQSIMNRDSPQFGGKSANSSTIGQCVFHATAPVEHFVHILLTEILFIYIFNQYGFVKNLKMRH